MTTSPWVIHTRHLAVAQDAMRSPGTAVLLDTYRDSRSAQWKVQHVKRNRAAAFRPAKDWKVTRDGSDIWVTYKPKKG